MTTTARASDFGRDATDATTALQSALDSDADIVVIDDVGADWVTRPLFVRRSNVTVLVEPRVVVRAMPGGYPNPRDSLLTVDDQRGVRISGYGATFVMNKAEYPTGQWQMTLKLRGVDDTIVEGLTLRDAGGDGIYVGRSPDHALSRNVVLRDLMCDGNARHGLSAVSVAGLRIEGCSFVRTKGSAPQAGIEFRTNFPEERLTDILVVDCVCEANSGSGIELVGGGLTPRSVPLSIRVVRSAIGIQREGRPQVMVGPSDLDTYRGTFEIETSVIRTDTETVALEMTSREPSGHRARTVHWDSGAAPATGQPILLLSRGDAASGNLTVSHCVLLPDVAPTPGDEVEIRSSASQVRGGAPVVLTFRRTGEDDSQPLAVPYTTGGSARERYDYGGLAHVVVIPGGQRETSLTVRTFPRRQPSDTRIRTVVFEVGGDKQDRVSHPQRVSVQIQG